MADAIEHLRSRAKLLPTISWPIPRRSGGNRFLGDFLWDRLESNRPSRCLIRQIHLVENRLLPHTHGLAEL
ncbi:hypothetical protein NXT3_PA00253 (plasmid) [Sinorhizobium fredii]|uniref:Uncharacterized protein n=1 Tax=Rhizobium fredii TaxID=380 RepID=A0A2L0HBH5_RHIFR|nr:hypothetical protein NXT3_PA00253 [Sinorhizobium fredii]